MLHISNKSIESSRSQIDLMLDFLFRCAACYSVIVASSGGIAFRHRRYFVKTNYRVVGDHTRDNVTYPEGRCHGFPLHSFAFVGTNCDTYPGVEVCGCANNRIGLYEDYTRTPHSDITRKEVRVFSLGVWKSPEVVTGE